VNDSTVTGYDVIGDVHGHVDALTRLLNQLGYRRVDGAYRHPSRRAVFVGDFIDRGPDSVGVVELGRSMVAAGSAIAVMGNHEFNAIGYATPDPERPGEFVRARSAKNQKQHAKFLEEVGVDSQLHQDIVGWFWTLPLWCELSLAGETLRVVHACWHGASIAALRSRLGQELTLTLDVLRAGSCPGNEIHDAIETVLKGPEVDMGHQTYFDKDGHSRSRARVAWWNAASASLHDVAVVPSNAKDEHGGPFAPLPTTAIDTAGMLYTDPTPVLFGHYWFTGEAAICSPTTGGVDYSVANKGKLVAYRWSGERELQNDHFVSVPSA